MNASSRARALTTHIHARLPFGLLPLAIAIATLVAVPLAHAATSAGDPTAPTGAIVPVAQDASFHPEVSGRVSDRSASRGDAIHVRGIVRHAGTGNARVVLAARRAGHRDWFKVAAARVKPGKKFTIRWSGSKPGRYLTKLTVTKYGKSASDHLGAAFVFRNSFASYYGPGLYGSGLACGGRECAASPPQRQGGRRPVQDSRRPRPEDRRDSGDALDGLEPDGRSAVVDDPRERPQEKARTGENAYPAAASLAVAAFSDLRLATGKRKRVFHGVDSSSRHRPYLGVQR